MFKKFLLKTFVAPKLKKSGMSDAQVAQLLEIIEKNPEFFKKIEAQIKAKKNQGIPEQAAMMTVMRENQAELQRLLMGFQK